MNMLLVSCILVVMYQQRVLCAAGAIQLDKNHNEQHNNVQRVSENVPARRSSKHNNTFIGFTAFKTSTQVVGTGDTVIFDGVSINIGGYYQPTLSRFTCPHNGNYFISLNYKISSSGILALSIFKGEEELLTLYNGRDENPGNIASVSGVAQCLEGEVISVKCNFSFLNSAVYGESGIPQTTFSVVLMNNGTVETLHNSFIGFTAKKLLPQHYDSLDTITFDQMLLNEGGYFNTALNRFVCTIPGIYYTSMTVTKYQDVDLHIGMMKESVPMLHSEEAGNTNWYNTLSNNRLIECSGGEHVLLMATDTGSVDGEDIAQSSFTMMLMYQQGTTKRNNSNLLHDNFIGFSAYKRSPQSYISGATIEFDSVMLNEGGFFEPALSQFICPLDAVYYVSVTFMKNDAEPLQLEVQRETIPFLRSIETESDNPWNTVSNSGLVHCFQGQDISVKAVDSGSVYGDLHKALTTFTVMLMEVD